MTERIEVKWSYSPKDFFEEQFSLEEEKYKIEIYDGIALLDLDSELFENDEEIIKKISKDIEDLFYGVQIIRFMEFEIDLNTYTMTRYKSDGTIHSTLAVSSRSASLTGESIDLKVTDNNGKTIADTKKQRINEEIELARLVRKYRRQDKTAESIFDSYQAAIEFPNYQISHFYEIREALKKKFGNEKGIRDYLNISKKKLDRLRILANREPLREGRKKGDHVGKLRPATNSELDEAKEIAKQLIVNYLRFLESEHLFKKE